MYETAVVRLVDRALIGGNALLLVGGTPGSDRSDALWGGGGSDASGAAGRGLLSLALADLALRWGSGSGGSVSSLTPRSSAASTVAVRLCAAEVGYEIRDLCGGSGGGGKQRTSAALPSKWALSARGVLAALASPSLSLNEGGNGICRRMSGGGGGADAAPTLLTSRVLVEVTEVRAEGVEEALASFRKVGQPSEGASVCVRFLPVLAIIVKPEQQKQRCSSRKAQQ